MLIILNFLNLVLRKHGFASFFYLRMLHLYMNILFTLYHGYRNKEMRFHIFVTNDNLL